MSQQPFAEMPAFSTSIGAVAFGTTAITRGGTMSQWDNTGGFGATSAPGGLLVQAPGLVLPMLWHRGSFLNLGAFGQGRFSPVAPPLGASDYTPNSFGPYARYWDAPQSWGRANYLIRRPRTLIIVADDDLTVGGLADIESWVNTNYSASFAPVNVSVGLFFSGASTGSIGISAANAFAVSPFAAGIPFSSSNSQNVNSTSTNPQLQWSMPATTPSQYTGGDCYIAYLSGCTMPLTYVQTGITDTSHTFQAVTGWNLTTAQGFGSSGNIWNGGTYVNALKAANDIAAQVAGSAKFRTYQMGLYQYNQNPTSLAYLLTTTIIPGTTTSMDPDPIIPDTMADTLLTGSTIVRKTFTVGNLTGMLAQVLADAVAFFPALP